MTKVGQNFIHYENTRKPDEPPVKESKNTNIHDAYRQYLEQQQQQFNNYKNEQNQKFEEFKNGNSANAGKSQDPNIQYAQDLAQPWTPMEAHPGEDTPVVDHPPVYYEGEELPAQVNTNPEVIDHPPVYYEGEELPAQVNTNPEVIDHPPVYYNGEEVPAQVNTNPEVIDHPPVNKQDNKTSRPMDFITGLNNSTKEYLGKDKKFVENEQAILEQTMKTIKLQEEIAEKKEIYINAERELRNAASADYSTKYELEMKRREAERNYKFKCFELDDENKNLAGMQNNLIKYASTIQNWKDGETFDVDKFDKYIHDGKYSTQHWKGTVTTVTLENGQKAYELNGKYYALTDTGEIDFYNTIEQ